MLWLSALFLKVELSKLRGLLEWALRGLGWSSFGFEDDDNLRVSSKWVHRSSKLLPMFKLDIGRLMVDGKIVLALFGLYDKCADNKCIRSLLKSSCVRVSFEYFLVESSVNALVDGDSMLRSI